jgi:GTP cyclohydrolase I
MKPSPEEVKQAIKTIISWIGDDPEREGLKETPDRVFRSYEELFSGYAQDPEEFLLKTFSETNGYDEMIILRDIRFESFCEHHMLPIVGIVNIAYMPNKRVVGISKLARIVDMYAKRLQIQEKFTVQIANAINNTLKPYGVAVVAKASHQCMTLRGVHKTGANMDTSHMLGCFRKDKDTRNEFLSLINAAKYDFSPV